MKIETIESADPETLAPLLLAALQRLGQHGRPGAIALSQLVADDDGEFDEGASWISSIAQGEI